MKKRIVVIEDDASIRDILKIILERSGYLVESHQGGMPVLEGKVDTPDMFIIDRQLSGVDGLEICRYIRSQPSEMQVPIIVLSATPSIQNVAKNAGANEFIEKPFSKSHLISTISKFLK
jgi:DNA-binding response OmpR family regulator